jgi:hypothetical protein
MIQKQWKGMTEKVQRLEYGFLSIPGNEPTGEFPPSSD